MYSLYTIWRGGFIQSYSQKINRSGQFNCEDIQVFTGPLSPVVFFIRSNFHSDIPGVKCSAHSAIALFKKKLKSRVFCTSFGSHGFDTNAVVWNGGPEESRFRGSVTVTKITHSDLILKFHNYRSGCIVSVYKKALEVFSTIYQRWVVHC